MTTKLLDDCDEPSDGLRAFLDDRPPASGQSPWVHFVMSNHGPGAHWRPHGQSCGACGSRVMTLALEPRGRRAPVRMTLCLDCGSVAISPTAADDSDGLVFDGLPWKEVNPLIIEIVALEIRERNRAWERHE